MSNRIQNLEALAENELRADALAIAEAGYAAIDVNAAVRGKVQVISNELRIGDKAINIADRKLFFVGVGKCAFTAAAAIEEVLGERLTAGVALDVSPLETPLTKIEAHVGTHPLPSEVNEAATKRIIEFLSNRAPQDLVLMLISGGGSTLLCTHEMPMTCEDESALWSALTAQGATIQEINTVRKHTSKARGGALVFAAYPAEVVSLIVSDVPGNDIAAIASGPTVLDTSSIADAEAVLAHYGITPLASIAFIETPKEQKYFERVTNILFISNQDALAAMQEEAGRRGYAASIADTRFTGEAREIGRSIAQKLHAAPANTALLYAGESTVTLSDNARQGGLVPPKPSGEGGRNQEMALAALPDIRDDELVLPFSSDGRDNTDHAGAIADSLTRAHALAKNLLAEEHLDTHRSYDFFTTSGDALITGYTGTNVSDLIIALKK